MPTRYTNLQWYEMLASDFGDDEVIRYRWDAATKTQIFTIGGNESDGEEDTTLGYHRKRTAYFDEWVNQSLKNIYGGDTREIPM